MSITTEKQLNYGLEGNLSRNQTFEEKNPKLIDIKLLESIYKKRVEKSITKSLFYSLCKQVVINQPMASHKSSKDHFAKAVELSKKT